MGMGSSWTVGRFAWTIVLLKERTRRLLACTWADRQTPETTGRVHPGAVAAIVTVRGGIEPMEEGGERTTAGGDHGVRSTDGEAGATAQGGGIATRHEDAVKYYDFFSFNISFGMVGDRMLS